MKLKPWMIQVVMMEKVKMLKMVEVVGGRGEREM